MKKLLQNACQSLCLTFDLDANSCEKKGEKWKSFNSIQKDTASAHSAHTGKQIQPLTEKEPKNPKFTKNQERPLTTDKPDLQLNKSMNENLENTNIEEETTNTYQKLLDKYRP